MVVLNAIYKIYTVKKYGKEKELDIRNELNNKLDKQKLKYNPKIPIYYNHSIRNNNGYQYALSEIFKPDERDPNTNFYEGGEINYQNFEIYPFPALYISVYVIDEKPIEYIIQNSDNENLKLTSLLYINNYLREICNGYQYFIFPVKKIEKKIDDDPSIWDCYYYNVKTNLINGKGYNLIFLYIRRSYIPPFFESFNDIIFIIKEEYLENQPNTSLSELPKVTTKIFLETLHPEEIKEENGVTKYIINIKLNAYLSGKNTTFFLIDYNKKNIISNECYKLFLECQTKIAIILNTYLNNNEFDYNSFLLKIKDAYYNMDGKNIDVNEYVHSIKYVDFDKIIEKSFKEFKKIFNILDPQAELFYRNKIAKYIGDTLLISSHTKNFLENFDKCLLIEDLYQIFKPIVNFVINFFVVFDNNEISINETINSIINKKNNISQISFNEDIVGKLIESGQLKHYQNIDNDSNFYKFLDYILKKKFSYHILNSIYKYISKIKGINDYQENEERFNDEIKSLKLNSKILLPTLMNLYCDYSQNPETIILSCKILIILITVSPENKELLFSIEFCQYLYSYFSTSYQELIYYSIQLFRKMTSFKSDLRNIIEEKPGFLIKLVNIIKGTGIDGCYYHPKLIYLIMDLFSEIIKNNQIKSTLFNQKNRKIIKYFIPYIGNFQNVFGQIDDNMSYYLPIVTKIYNFLELLVLKDSEMRRYIENTFHLIKIINERCIDYIQIVNFEYKKTKKGEDDEMITNIERGKKRNLFLKSIIQFLNTYVSSDSNLKKTIKSKGKNIVSFVILLKHKNSKDNLNEEKKIEEQKNETQNDYSSRGIGNEDPTIHKKYIELLDELLDKLTI